VSYEAPDPTKLRIKPTYNVGDFGHDLVIPLVNTQSSNVQTLTASTATFEFTAEDSAQPIDEQDVIISDTDKVQQLHAGNDTAYTKSWVYHPDMTAWLYKISFNLGIGLKCSAFTNGTTNIGDVTITITQIGDGAGDKVIFSRAYDSQTTALTGTGELISNFHADIVAPVKLTNALPVKIDLTIGHTKTGTNTSQIGFLPFYPYVPTAVPKLFTVSSVAFHVHASLDHAFPIWRDQDNDQRLDYSGISAEQAGLSIQTEAIGNSLSNNPLPAQSEGVTY